DSYPQKQANIAQYRVRIADLARKVRDRQRDAKEMPAARRNYLRVTVRNYRCGSRRREIASHQETCIDGLLLSGAVTPAGFGLGPFIVFCVKIIEFRGEPLVDVIADQVDRRLQTRPHETNRMMSIKLLQLFRTEIACNGRNSIPGTNDKSDRAFVV